MKIEYEEKIQKDINMTIEFVNGKKLTEIAKVYGLSCERVRQRINSLIWKVLCHNDNRKEYPDWQDRDYEIKDSELLDLSYRDEKLKSKLSENRDIFMIHLARYSMRNLPESLKYEKTKWKHEIKVSPEIVIKKLLKIMSGFKYCYDCRISDNIEKALDKCIRIESTEVIDEEEKNGNDKTEGGR